MAGIYGDWESRLIQKRNVATVIVAANNSDDIDKLMADYICDGTNDEVELQAAVDYFNGRSGKIILCNGDYYIDTLTYSGSATYGYFGIMIANEANQREIIIEGCNAPYRKTNTQDLCGGPVLRLSQTAYNTLGAADLCTIIGSIPKISDGTFTYPGRSFITKNIGIMLPGNQKKICGIDGSYFTIFKFDGIIVSLEGLLSSWVQAITGCVGIRGIKAGMFGCGYRGDNCFMYGMRIGYDITGEHLVMVDCGARYCVYPMGLGISGAGTHPNAIINFCDEGCVNGVRFNDGSKYQSINFINYNMELVLDGTWQRVQGATENNINGGYNGIVSYAAIYNAYREYLLLGYINTEAPFWAPGHGNRFKTVCMTSLLQGTTANRPKIVNYYQQYYDTTLGKPVYLKAKGEFEICRLTITAAATASGNITITLNGVANTVAVVAGDTANEIAAKIVATYTILYFYMAATNNVVRFEKRTPGVNDAPAFSGGATGVTGSFVVNTAGTENVWIDMAGIEV